MSDYTEKSQGKLYSQTLQSAD